MAHPLPSPPTNNQPPAQRETHSIEIDQALGVLRNAATPFARSSLAERVALARRLRKGYLSVASASVEAACQAKGIDRSSPLSAEEWLAGPLAVVRALRLYIGTLERLRKGGPPIAPGHVRGRVDGRAVVDVFPESLFDRVLFAGFHGEVWMQPDVQPEKVLDRAAPHYRTPPAERAGKVALVLGAGNVASIPALDVLHKLLSEGQVCILKMNPVNAYLGPLIERGFAAAVEQNLLRVVYGGGATGAYLASHPLVDEVHITGSDKTHDLIVWGPVGAEREERKARRQPLLQKEITSELGNVSPVVVVPGPYSDEELTFQAESIAAAVTNNASFNCNAAKLLVLPRHWTGREPLLGALRAALARTPPRAAYYPGAKERYRALVDGHPHVETIGDGAGALPWTLITELDAENAKETCFSVEPFCSILSVVDLPEEEPHAFLDAAVRFVNERVWGTLSATVVVHPVVRRALGEAFDHALGSLRYGAVGVNHWPALIYALGTLPWGGHPSSTLENIQSGRGFVHNTFLLDGIEKAVLYGPLVVRPRPLWFAGHRTAHEVAEALVALEGADGAASWWQLPNILWGALRG